MFLPESMLSEQELHVLKNIWKSLAHSKIIGFSWKLLRNQIPTRVNLEHRGIQGIGAACTKKVRTEWVFFDLACYGLDDLEIKK
jgi:hypothetical protein